MGGGGEVGEVGEVLVLPAAPPAAGGGEEGVVVFEEEFLEEGGGGGSVGEGEDLEVGEVGAEREEEGGGGLDEGYFCGVVGDGVVRGGVGVEPEELVLLPGERGEYGFSFFRAEPDAADVVLDGGVGGVVNGLPLVWFRPSQAATPGSRPSLGVDDCVGDGAG